MISGILKLELDRVSPNWRAFYETTQDAAEALLGTGTGLARIVHSSEDRTARISRGAAEQRLRLSAP